MSFEIYEALEDDALPAMLSAVDNDASTGEQSAIPHIILELTKATRILDTDQIAVTTETVQLLVNLGASATPTLVETQRPSENEVSLDSNEALQTLEEIRKQIKELGYRATLSTDHEEQNEITKQLVKCHNKLKNLPESDATLPKLSSLRDQCHHIVLDLYTDAVNYIVRKRSMPGYDEGLTEAVKFGLLTAFDRFDETKGGSFNSYAFVLMDGEALKNGRDTLRTKGLKRTAYGIYPTLMSLQDQGYDDAEIAKKLGKTAKQLQKIRQQIDWALNIESLDGTWDDPEQSYGNPLDVLHRDDTPVEDEVTLLELDNHLLAALQTSNFDERDLEVLRYSFGIVKRPDGQFIQIKDFEPYPQHEIGEIIGHSQMHVSRIRKRLIDRLSESYFSQQGI